MTLQEIADALKAALTELEAIAAKDAPTDAEADKAIELAKSIKELEGKKLKAQQLIEIRENIVKTKAADAELLNKANNGLNINANAEIKGGESSLKRMPEAKLKSYQTGLALQALARGNEQASQTLGELGIVCKTHGMATDTEGGAFVPEEVSNYIIDLSLQYGVFRRNARVESMNSETKRVPRITNDVTAYWGSEGGAYTASQIMTAGSIVGTARKLTALSIVSNELEMNATIDMGARFAISCARQFAKAEDQAGFLGDGTSTYGGITGLKTALLNLSATRANIASAVVGTGNLFSEITLEDFRKMKAKLPGYARTTNTKWYINYTAESEIIERLVTAINGTTQTEIANGMVYNKFLGYNVELVEVLPNVDANDVPIAWLGDLKLSSTFFDRKSLAITRDLSQGFLTDQTYIKAVEYVDIVNHEMGNASATASARVAGPIIGLLSAAS